MYFQNSQNNINKEYFIFLQLRFFLFTAYLTSKYVNMFQKLKH